LYSNAFNYWMTNAAVLESNYPYTHLDGTCKNSTVTHTSVKTTGFTSVTANDPTAMKAGVAIKPLSVRVAASDSSFGQYSSGIYNNTACGTSTNHATLVVGWGVNSSNVEYWIMKNSWGTGWGENGYMRVKIIAGNGNCGIQMYPKYPNL